MDPFNLPQNDVAKKTLFLERDIRRAENNWIVWDLILYPLGNANCHAHAKDSEDRLKSFPFSEIHWNLCGRKINIFYFFLSLSLKIHNISIDLQKMIFWCRLSTNFLKPQNIYIYKNQITKIRLRSNLLGIFPPKTGNSWREISTLEWH